MPSVTARSLGVIMWCLPLVLQPSTTLASELQTKNPNAPPAFNESAHPPGAQPRDGSPGKQPLASPSVDDSNWPNARNPNAVIFFQALYNIVAWSSDNRNAGKPF